MGANKTILHKTTQSIINKLDPNKFKCALCQLYFHVLDMYEFKHSSIKRIIMGPVCCGCFFKALDHCSGKSCPRRDNVIVNCTVCQTEFIWDDRSLKWKERMYNGKRW